VAHDDAIEARIAQMQALFVDGTTTEDLAEAEAMVALGSGSVDDGLYVTGDQILLMSATGCTNYWLLGPEHNDATGIGAYASLVPGQNTAWMGSLRAAARVLVDHDLRVQAELPHVTCAARSRPGDYDAILDEVPRLGVRRRRRDRYRAPLTVARQSQRAHPSGVRAHVNAAALPGQQSSGGFDAPQEYWKSSRSSFGSSVWSAQPNSAITSAA
jgi:hypothetical protein